MKNFPRCSLLRYLQTIMVILIMQKPIFGKEKNGADIVKLQTYEPRNMTIDSLETIFLLKMDLERIQIMIYTKKLKHL